MIIAKKEGIFALVMDALPIIISLRKEELFHHIYKGVLRMQILMFKYYLKHIK